MPGIDVTDDPLLQARNFSYLDTQLTRLGGPNFDQIPINRPHAPVNDMLRDGYHQHAVHRGVAPYRPNSLDGGCPFTVGGTDDDASVDPRGVFEDAAVTVPVGKKVRDQPASYDDHFSQARLFWESMSGVEKEHIVRAYTFELGKCFEQPIKERQLQALANIDPRLCSEVATGLGLPAPGPTLTLVDPAPSPALSQVGDAWPLDGRIVGLVVGAETTSSQVEPVRAAVSAAGLVPLVIGPHGGSIDGVGVQRTFATGRSVELDVLLLLDTPAPAPDALGARDEKGAGRTTVDPRVLLMVQECYRHSKVVGVLDSASGVLADAGVGAEDAAVVVAASPEDLWASVQEPMSFHRAWERFPAQLG